MSDELRKPLIETIANPQEYQNEVALSGWITCMATIFFSNEEKYTNVEYHKLYVRASDKKGSMV